MPQKDNHRLDSPALAGRVIICNFLQGGWHDSILATGLAGPKNKFVDETEQKGRAHRQTDIQLTCFKSLVKTNCSGTETGRKKRRCETVTKAVECDIFMHKKDKCWSKSKIYLVQYFDVISKEYCCKMLFDDRVSDCESVNLKLIYFSDDKLINPCIYKGVLLNWLSPSHVAMPIVFTQFAGQI